MQWKQPLMLFGIIFSLSLVGPSGSNLTKGNTNLVQTVFRESGVRDRINICSSESYLTLKGLSCDNNGTCGNSDQNTMYQCKCKDTHVTYVVSQGECMDNKWLRRGCDLRFGSWRYSQGWTWSSINDTLPSLYLVNGYGITGAFNISNRDFKSCQLTNVTMLMPKREIWAECGFDQKDISFFIYKRYFHISWNTENLSKDIREKISGRLLRFNIQCEPQETIMYNDISRKPFESCLTFKVTGSFKTGFPQIMNPDTPAESSTGTLTIILAIIFPILAIAGLVTGFICYRRRTLSKDITPRFVSHFMARIT